MKYKIPEEIRNSTSWRLNEVRDALSKLRSDIADLNNKSHHAGYIEGYLSTGIVAMYHAVEDTKETELRMLDHAEGKGYKFSSRGIGTDCCPGCFACGPETSMESASMANIAAYIRTKEEGEIIVGWFNGRARVDFRAHEPNYIQLKVGACEAHLENLEYLRILTDWYDVIRKTTIEKAVNYKRVK